MVPATAGLFSHMPVYGYYKATGFYAEEGLQKITWAPYSDGQSNNYSNGITLSDNKVILFPNYNGLYEITVSGDYISSEGNTVTVASLFFNCNNVVRYRVWYNSFSTGHKTAYPCGFTALYRQIPGGFTGFSVDGAGMNNVNHLLLQQGAS